MMAPVLQEDQRKQHCRNRWLVLIFGTISMLFLGLIYAWSIFVTPIEAEFGWTRAQTTVTFTCTMLGLYIGMLLAGMLAAKLSASRVMLLGTLLIAAGFVASAFLHSLFTLYLFYGVFIGGGTGLCYNTLLPNAMLWYPEHSGLVSGILLAGFGMGSLVLGRLVSMLMSSAFGWRRTFFCMGVLMLVELTIARLCAGNPPAQEKAAPITDPIAITPAQMLRDPTFYLFALWRAGLSFVSQCIIGQAASIVTDTGASAAFAALVVGLLSLGNGLGRPLIGLLHDRLGNTRSMLLVSMMSILAAICLTFAYQSQNTTVVTVGLIAVGFAYGGLALLVSAFSKTVFGSTYFKTNYGIGSMASVPVTFLTPYIGIVKTNTGSYQNFFYVMLLLCSASLLCALIIPSVIKRLYRSLGLDASGQI